MMSLKVCFVSLLSAGILFNPLTTDRGEAIAIANSSFETPELVDGFPTAFGDWGIDVATIVEAENGIVHLEGERMLRFDSTAPSSFGPGANGLDSGTGQLIDIRSILDSVRDGTAAIELSASFNRVAGDAQTDTNFGVLIRSFTGDPSTFPARWPQWTAQSLEILSADSAPNTWESIATELLLPANTDFVEVAVLGFENISNDAPPFEFDGHYADRVSLTAKGTEVPEPTSILSFLTCLGLGAASSIGKLVAKTQPL